MAKQDRRRESWPGSQARYRFVADTLRRWLASGALAPGVKLPQLRVLADRFKVSVQTVRWAIRLLEEEGLLYHLKDVGAFARPVPAAYVTVTSVVLATMDMSRRFEMEIARGVEHACRELGWGLQVLDAQADPGTKMRNLRRMAQLKARLAIVITSGDLSDIELLVQLKLDGCSIVLINQGVLRLQLDRVESDYEEAAYRATRHLVRHGHRPIYLTSGLPGSEHHSESILGFERALVDGAIEFSREMLRYVNPQGGSSATLEDRPWRGGYETAMSLLAETRSPIALLADTDGVAWGIMRACRELGLRIPEDVSLVVLEDSELARALTPPLAAISHQPWQMGNQAVEFLRNRMENNVAFDEPQHARIGIELIERASVAPFPD